MLLQPHHILIPGDIGVDFNADETGETYLENSLIKAQALFRSSDAYPIIADDSGLAVPALGGAPGVRSARYGEVSGRYLNDEERNRLLLKNAAHLQGEDRRASFVCCITLMVDEYRIFTVQETFNGYIADSPSGRGGFGYDPIFYLPKHGCCVAELTGEEKNSLSHRGRAARLLLRIINALGEEYNP